MNLSASILAQQIPTSHFQVNDRGTGSEQHQAVTLQQIVAKVEVRLT